MLLQLKGVLFLLKLDCPSLNVPFVHKSKPRRRHASAHVQARIQNSLVDYRLFPGFLQQLLSEFLFVRHYYLLGLFGLVYKSCSPFVLDLLAGWVHKDS
jgi:hypothetical protein